MSISIENRDDIVLITPDDDFTIFFLQELKDQIYKKIENGSYKFIFNFENVGWIDSMGISVLILAGKVAAEKGIKAYVYSANDKVKYSIELLKIGDYVEIVPTIDEALSKCNS